MKTKQQKIDEIEDQEFRWGEEREYTEEYPYGGNVIEPVDIEKEKELTK